MRVNHEVIAAVAAIPGGVRRRAIFGCWLALLQCRSRRDSGGREADEVIGFAAVKSSRSRRDSGGREAERETGKRCLARCAAVAAIPGGVRRVRRISFKPGGVQPQSPRFRGA